MSDVSTRVAGTSLTTFTDAEVRAMVTEAHRLGAKIVAHASEAATLRRLTADAQVHVDSIEHGYSMSELLSPKAGDESPGIPPAFKEKPVFWVPTLAAYYTLGQSNGVWERAAQSFREYLKKRPEEIRIACGGDTGVFAHGDNALEMKLMLRLGAPWRQVLKWCTIGGWECVRSMRWEGEEGEVRLKDVERLMEEARIVGTNEVPFGVIRKGFAADIIATSGSLWEEFENAVDRKSISFVMKGGKVYKRNGQEVVVDA